MSAADIVAYEAKRKELYSERGNSKHLCKCKECRTFNVRKSATMSSICRFWTADRVQYWLWDDYEMIMRLMNDVLYYSLGSAVHLYYLITLNWKYTCLNIVVLCLSTKSSLSTCLLSKVHLSRPLVPCSTCCKHRSMPVLTVLVAKHA